MLRKLGLGVATLLLAGAMTACTAGQGVAVPDREVMIDAQTALDAQNLAMGGLMMGSVTLDESQFSSLLTGLLQANSGENLPVEDISAWFEADAIYLQVNLKEGVLPAAFGNSLAVAGTVDASDGRLVLDLTQASAGTYKVEGAALAPITAQINNALSGYNFGMPIQVETAQGSLTVSMAQ